MKKYFIEFIGSFFIMLVLGLSGNPLTLGTMLAGLLYIGKPISGGHFNPIVSMSFWGIKKISFSQALIYSLLQFLGASLATLIILFFQEGLGETVSNNSTTKLILNEILFSYVLIFSYLVLYNPSETQAKFDSLGIGFIMVAALLAGNNVAFSLFNPVLAMGACILGKIPLEQIAYYFLGEVLGGVLAVFSMRLMADK